MGKKFRISGSSATCLRQKPATLLGAKTCFSSVDPYGLRALWSQKAGVCTANLCRPSTTAEDCTEGESSAESNPTPGRHLSAGHLSCVSVPRCGRVHIWQLFTSKFAVCSLSHFWAAPLTLPGLTSSSSRTPSSRWWTPSTGPTLPITTTTTPRRRKTSRRPHLQLPPSLHPCSQEGPFSFCQLFVPVTAWKASASFHQKRMSSPSSSGPAWTLGP